MRRDNGPFKSTAKARVTEFRLGPRPGGEGKNVRTKTARQWNLSVVSLPDESRRGLLRRVLEPLEGTNHRGCPGGFSWRTVKGDRENRGALCSWTLMDMMRRGRRAGQKSKKSFEK